MTESEWLSATDPGAMLAHVLDTASPRKLRLFVCACARQLWDQFRDERSRRGIEVSERFADGLAPEEERQAAWAAAVEARAAATWDATREAIAAAWTALTDAAVGATRVIDDVARVHARRAALDAARKGLWRAVPATRDQAGRSARARQCGLL